MEDDAEGDDTESDDSAEADDVEGEDAEGDDTTESADEDDKASALSTASEDDAEREDAAEFSPEQITEATQAVGATSSGQTVILVDVPTPRWQLLRRLTPARLLQWWSAQGPCRH